MSRLGDKARTYRLPTIINGALTYKTLELDRGRWVAVCFVPKLGVIEADLLDRYATDVELLGATLVLVSMDAGRSGRNDGPRSESLSGSRSSPARRWSRGRSARVEASSPGSP